MAVPKTQRPSALAELLRAPSLPFLLTAAAVAVGLSALLPLMQSSDATSISGEIQRLRQEKADWQAQLHEMEAEVATLGSLTRIEREAKERLHMVAPEDTVYIAVDVPAPEERTLPSRFLPQAADDKDEGPSLWDRLFGWIPLP